MSRRVGVAGLAAVTLFVAGCGGSKVYSLDKTKACLEKEHGVRLHAVPASDFVASLAEGGSVLVRLPSRNQVTLAFGQNRKEADRISDGYRRYHGRNIGIADVLRPDHNAVLLWRQHPSERDISSVKGCLR